MFTIVLLDVFEKLFRYTTPMPETFIKFIEYSLAPIGYIFSANQRIYWLYLLSAIVLMLLSAWYSKKRLLPLLQASLKKKYWFNHSTSIDIKWIILNQMLAVLLILPILTGQITWSITTYKLLLAWFGDGEFVNWPSEYVTLCFTIVLFTVDDFSRFFIHYCYHKVPFLWRFHAIHHSAKIMTPLTLYRIHFVEYAINSARALLITGTVGGIFMYLFNGKIGLFEVLGVSLLTMLFNLAGANLRHSHIWLSFGKFERIFISPAQHQIHHSSAKHHLDKNFGSALAIWDRLFGSWLSSSNQEVKKYGLYQQSSPQSIKKQWLGLRPKKMRSNRNSLNT